MHTFRTVLLASLVVGGALASACSGMTNAATAPTSPAPPEAGAQVQGQIPRCNQAKAQWAIGQPASTELLERARLDAGAALARFLRPDERITLEYSASRLNITLDARDVASSVYCG
jgi:hypothetical protein